MPRIRPLRTVEEIAKVPMDKEVVISLDDVSDTGKPLDTKKDDKELDLGISNNTPEGRLEEADPFEEVVKTPKRTKEPVEDDASADLKAQLDDMRKAYKEAEERAHNAERLRQEALAEAKRRQAEARQSDTRAEDAEYDAILNAIGAAESDIERASNDLERAQTDGDNKMLADATRRISRAESRLVQLQDGKEHIERNKLLNKDKKEEILEQRVVPTVEQQIDQMPNLLPSQKTWLKAHPDAVTDARKYQRLGAYHFEAEDKGFQPGTQKYFDYLDERLGYKEPIVNDDNEEDDEPVTRRTVQAPPSRGSISPNTGKTQNSRITLTPQEREAAEIAGVDPLVYATNKRKLEQLKSEGYYHE